MILRYQSGQRLFRISELQWGPTTTSHDPNPPITLESLNSYSLTAGQGSFAVTGEDAALVTSKRVTAAQGAFVLTGEAAGLAPARAIAADEGSFILTGESASLTAIRQMAAAQGSFTMTGNDAGVAIGRPPLVAAQGSFALTGEAAQFSKTQKLQADQGSFALTGKDATFLIEHVLQAAILKSEFDPNFDYNETGFTLIGKPAALLKNSERKLDAEVRKFHLAGQDASLLHNGVLNAGTGSFALTGFHVADSTDRTLLAETGQFALMGQSVNLRVIGPPPPPPIPTNEVRLVDASSTGIVSGKAEVKLE